jgi:hypothetical protein
MLRGEFEPDTKRICRDALAGHFPERPSTDKNPSTF